LNPDLLRLRNQASKLYLEALELIRSLLKLLDPVESRREVVERDILEKTEMLSISCGELVNNILVFIARNQPLGVELVEASNLLYIVYDIYRFSRYSREILIADRKGVRLYTPGLRELVEPALNMASEAVEYSYKVYFDGNSELLNQLKALGEESDRLYLSQLEKISRSTKVDNTDAIALLILRHIERIVDHAERVASLSISTSS